MSIRAGRFLFAIWVLGCGCRKVDGDGATAPPLLKTVTAAPATNPCEPRKLGLGEAKVIAQWQLPASCQAQSSGGPRAPITIRSEADFKKTFSCSPAEPSGVDFLVSDLVVSPRMLSPGGVGASVADDGVTTTIISMFRPPCPDDPHPMPVPYTIGFLLPAKSKRTYAEKSCNVETTCK